MYSNLVQFRLFVDQDRVEAKLKVRTTELEASLTDLEAAVEGMTIRPFVFSVLGFLSYSSLAFPARNKEIAKLKFDSETAAQVLAAKDVALGKLREDI